MASQTDIAIIGAGPYGLSIAAFLNHSGVNFRIFGRPMQSWDERMPQGMLLKSEGFASSLYDPESEFTLSEFCKEQGIPYEDVGLAVSRENFVAYGKEFQRRLVPNLEQTDIQSLSRKGQGFVPHNSQRGTRRSEARGGRDRHHTLSVSAADGWRTRS